MDQLLSCQCGKLQGKLSHPEQCTRIKCYCLDCQAFAAYLRKDDIVDQQGGTDVVVAHPRLLTFTAGQDALQCMSLSAKGMLRWYAGCCNTPIGNTTRTIKGSFVGLTHNFLARTAAEMDAAFGPVRMVSCTDSARSPVPSSGWRAVRPMLGFVRQLLAARLSGSYRSTPFFTPDDQPLVTPAVLTPAARAALDRQA